MGKERFLPVSTVHPDFEAEQRYIEHAYACLEATRAAASRLGSMVEVPGRGGTQQARYERDVIWDTMLHRLAQLDLGDASLCFGRIDLADHEATGGTSKGNGNGNGSGNGSSPKDAPGPTGGTGSFYIGRIAVADETQEPVVVDWRAPVAEPFYRATGRDPMGLARRRHFATRGRTLLGIEDELFGDAVAALDLARPEIQGQGALIAALEEARTGHLTDIVATIQAEQDEIIRADLPGVLVVQGGPGTGKTVVALHRAAYLLYTHRFPLEGQGVLVVGPNKVFLGYIEQVLPSLGEAGVELAVLADLVDGVRVRSSERGLSARVKGDLRMTDVLAHAVADRERPLRSDLTIGVGAATLTITAKQSRGIVREAKRRYRNHNAARRYVEAQFFETLSNSSWRRPDPGELRHDIRGDLPIREALEWMWPVLTPAQLLHDLLGSRALLRSAAREVLDDAEIEALHRERAEGADDVVWTTDDVPLLDEALHLLGPRPNRKDDDQIRTYGHIVVDEAQDLSPMQLRVLTRRSLSGSMTVVGDIAQATGAWAHASWDEVLTLLPDKRAPRRAELTVGYRIPAAITEPAARVLAVAAPDLQPPRAVREGGDPPRWVQVRPPETRDEALAALVRSEVEALGNGNVAVIGPTSMHDDISRALRASGVDHGHALRDGLDHQVTVLPVGLAKGLELDGAIVVEPAAILDEEPQGLRALYVSLTRATKRLAVLHERPVPAVLAE
jgi:DNA helicase IV